MAQQSSDFSFGNDGRLAESGCEFRFYDYIYIYMILYTQYIYIAISTTRFYNIPHKHHPLPFGTFEPMFFFSLGGVCSFPGGQGLYREGMLLLLKGNQHRIIMNPDLFVYTFLLALGKNNTDEIYRKVFILMPIMFAILIIIGILLFMAAKITLSKKNLMSKSSHSDMYHGHHGTVSLFHELCQ